MYDCALNVRRNISVSVLYALCLWERITRVVGVI